jgi:hypothetical protein
VCAAHDPVHEPGAREDRADDLARLGVVLDHEHADAHAAGGNRLGRMVGPLCTRGALRERQQHGERGAGAGAGTDRAHGAAVQVDHVSHDAEPEAEPRMLAPRGAVGLAEAIEYVGQEVGGDPLAGVSDLQDRLARRALHDHVDAAARRRELDRVREQVQHDLLQAIAVAVHEHAVDGHLERDLDALLFGSEPLRLDRGLGDRAQVERLDREQQLAAHDPRNVEQVLDQLRLRARGAVDRLDRFLMVLLVERAREQEMRPADDRVHGRAQLVREIGEELVLELGRLFGLAARDPLALVGILAVGGSALALGHVEHEAQKARAAISEPGRRDQHPHGRAVLAQVLALDGLDGSAAQEIGQPAPRARDLVGHADALPGDVRELGAVVAEQREEGVVGVEDRAVLDHRDADDVRVDQAAPARLALAQAVLGLAQAQQHAHGRDELVRLQRFGQVDLGAALEPDLLVLLGHERGGDLHDRDRRGGVVVLEPARDVDAVHVGQIDVEQQERGPLLADQAQRLRARLRLDHRIPGRAQRARAHVPGRLGVVDVQDQRRLRPQRLGSRHPHRPPSATNSRARSAESSFFCSTSWACARRPRALVARQDARRHDRDRHAVEVGVVAQLAEHRFAAAVGQVQIEEDRRRARAACRAQPASQSPASTTRVAPSESSFWSTERAAGSSSFTST